MKWVLGKQLPGFVTTWEIYVDDIIKATVSRDGGGYVVRPLGAKNPVRYFNEENSLNNYLKKLAKT